MSQVTLAELKAHLSLASDYAGDDVRLQGLIDVAEVRIGRHLRRDLAADFPAGWPHDLKHAVKIYAAFLDEQREPGDNYAAKHGLPMMVADMCASYRDLAE